MKRHLMHICLFVCLIVFLTVFPHASAERLERRREQGAVGKSLMGLQKGVQGVVGGFWGIGKHGAKFLYYGARESLSGFGRKAKKTDQKLRKSLW